jgi:endonuclease VIII
MAEGDTILRAARRIEEAIGRQEIGVAAPNPRGRAAGVERLDGRRLDSVETHGKHLMLHFGELVLHSHLGIGGSWHVYRQGDAWRKPRGAAWVALEGKAWEAVQFGGPTLRVLTAAAARRDPQLSRLGPDILAADFDPDAIVRSLRSSGDRALGDALLDQNLVAGIGNIFKSEACFAARLDPWQPVSELSDERLGHVVQAAHELMRDAVGHGRQSRTVYRRAGQPCPTCGTAVLSRGQGDSNRTTYWCPQCQAPESEAGGVVSAPVG